MIEEVDHPILSRDNSEGDVHKFEVLQPSSVHSDFFRLTANTSAPLWNFRNILSVKAEFDVLREVQFIGDTVKPKASVVSK
jgi:hypothetical protein